MKIRDHLNAGSIDGQALIEFALVVPILILLIIGLFDLGWAVYANNMVPNAAREGARSGVIVAKSYTDIRTRVKNTAVGLNLSDGQIQIQPSPNRTFGTPITVTVVYSYTPLTPLIGRMFPSGSLILQSRSAMMVEGVLSP